MAPTIRPSTPKPAAPRTQARSLPAATPVEDTKHTVAIDSQQPSSSPPSRSGSAHASLNAALTTPQAKPVVRALPDRGLAPPFISGHYKASYPTEAYEDEVGLRVIHMLAPDGASTRYLMTEAQNQGTYGKIKYAYDANHNRVALKEMRLVVPRTQDALSKFGLPKTLVMSPDDVRDEAQRTAVCRTVIDSHLAARLATLQGRDPLAGMRQGISSFQVYEVVEVGDKMYMAMSPESGDLTSLSVQVERAERPVFALSACAQTYFELSAMHAAGFAHLDVKPENLLFSRTGQIKLGDFGMACANVAGETHLGLRGPVGTIPAPDMLLTDDELDGDGNWQSVLLTQATDVWVAAITTLQLLYPTAEKDNPMLYQRDAQGRVDHVATSTRLAHFEVWRREALDVDGALRPQALQGDNVFSRYFAQAHKASPHLCNSLLARALVARVDLRATSREMAQIFESMAAKASPTEQAQVQALFARGHAALGQDAAFEALDRYQEWFSEQGA